ncbi:hypothetical protein EK21DRAFT_86043 [Setomelanomma holmii]|uniref:Uncharacterized protein n=1 Tax=Setomelanomma holmii TaxID=210430 RepID=A0A9P4HHY5_9PLEO|nr:hypothetical protein EK21DRAFT_86043 [Setomelanomma holmii]
MASQPTFNVQGNSPASSAPAPAAGASAVQNQAASNEPADHSFDRGLYAPNIAGGLEPDRSIDYIINRLMHPPWSMYSTDGQTVTLPIAWAVGIIEREHFEESRVIANHRLVLRGDTPMRAQLQAEFDAGRLSGMILSWLQHGEGIVTVPPSQFEQIPHAQGAQQPT